MATVAENLLKLKRGSEFIIPMGVVGILVLMILPVPAIVLDLFLTFNITLAIVILLISVYLSRPLDFGSFPTILLIVTLFRLSLNVASTRLILLNGNEGIGAAGQVIRSFGNFVVGGNYAVGFIIFAILIIINFMVITKGAGRIAEVAARFTLDAMPGKQMAIDADLNAGLIADDEARERRKEISLEADFYGAMDGASKFVRGDAIAGLLITLINIVGGLGIGVLQMGMPIVDAATTYTILTVGDGLVTQIPALIISTAAGLVVSNVTSDKDLSNTIAAQFTMSPKPLFVAAVILFLFGLIPGLPHLAFILFAALTGGAAFMIKRGQERRVEEEEVEREREATEAEVAPVGEVVEEITPIDTLGLEVGYRIIPLVDPAEGGELLERIKAIRRQFAEDMGIIVPSVHIKDNLQMKPSEYVFLVKGVEVARGELMVGHSLAINPGDAQDGLEGVPTADPAFGLPSIWVDDSNQEKAHIMGYTVVNHSAVIATHITEIIKNYSDELLGRQDVQNILDKVGETQPKVVEELVPGILPLGSVQKVMQNLLKERVSVRDIQTILETLADYGTMTKDTDLLTEYVRMNLSRQISQTYQTGDATIEALALNHDIEEIITKSIQETPQGSFMTIEPGVAQDIIFKVKDGLEELLSRGHQPVVLASHQTRRFVRKLLERTFPTVGVLSHGEIATTVRVETLKVVRL